MKKIILFFLLIITGFSYAGWSAFAHVTPETEKKYEFSVKLTPVKNKKNTYRVKLTAIDYDEKHAWLITAPKEVSPEKQDFRNFIWYPKSVKKEKLKKTELHPKGKKNNLYYEIEISSNKIYSSYIYIDFPYPIEDGGYYYSIDLKSYLLKFENNDNNIDFLKLPFKKIEFKKSKIVFEFKDLGARYFYKIKSDDTNSSPKKLSCYGEKIIIQKNDTLTLKARDSNISISNCDKLNANDKKLFKDLEKFLQNAYVINKKVNLKFRGEGVKTTKIFVFLTNELTINEKSSLIKLLQNNPDFSVKEVDNIIVAKYKTKQVQ